MVKFLKNSVKPLEVSQLESRDASFHLRVVQQPVKARVAGRKQTRNSSRRLVDPQPVVEIRLNEFQDQGNDSSNIIDHCLSMFFVRASIECLGSSSKEHFFLKQRKPRFYDKNNSEQEMNVNEDEDVIRGTTTVSAQFYRGSPYTACAVFDNLSVRYKGNYRLKFDLFEMQTFNSPGRPKMEGPKIIHWKKATSYSSVFTVYTDAAFDGLEASPELNNELKKAGCKIRARKQRNVLGTAGPGGMGTNLFNIDGFKINKNFTYQQGQMKYNFNNPNHFGLSQDIFNRPGTSIDIAMIQNYGNNQTMIQNLNSNLRTLMDSNNAGNVCTAATPRQIQQSQSVTSSPLVKLSNNETFGNPMDEIKRPMTTLPQLVTTGDNFDFNASYNDMLRSAALTADYNEPTLMQQPQPRRVQNALFTEMVGQMSPDRQLQTPVANSANSSNMHMSFNDQYSFNDKNVAIVNPNDTPLGQLNQGKFPNNFLDNGDATGNVHGMVHDVPRSTLPMEPIPMYWDNAQQLSGGVMDQTQFQNMDQQQQEQQHQQQQQHHQQHHSQEVVDGVNLGQLDFQKQQRGVTDNDISAELMQFNEMYQSGMLQNFEM